MAVTARRLNQLLAVEKDVKNSTLRELTDLHHEVQKTALLGGISRTYQPRDEEGERLPGEYSKVQVKASTMLTNVADRLAALIDVTAAKDRTNCEARGDIVVDGTVLVADVPATTLLFLEKQLTDINTIVDKLPTLDPGKDWTYSPAQDCYASDAVQTTRTKKVLRNHVRAEATDKHPAQVDVYPEDVVVGYWTTVTFSGALPAKIVTELRRRVHKLRAAVKVAREQANMTEVIPHEIGATLMDYLIADVDTDADAHEAAR